MLHVEGGTIFHSSEWLLKYSSKLCLLIVRNGKDIIGGLPYVLTSKYSVKGYHPLPYTYFGGPLVGKVDNQLSEKEQEQTLKTIISNLNKVGHYDFITNRTQDILIYHQHGFSISALQTYLIKYSDEDYKGQLNQNKKRELNKLLKLVEEGEISIDYNPPTTESVNLLIETGDRSGFNANRQVVQKMLENPVRKALKIGIMHKEDGLISFGYFPYDQSTMYNLINASKRIDHRILKTVNLLLLHLAITEARKRKLDFDFEGSMIPGVAAFYRLMGGKPRLNYRIQKSRSLFYQLLRFLKRLKHEYV